jgi:hypothetical protein
MTLPTHWTMLVMGLPELFKACSTGALHLELIHCPDSCSRVVSSDITPSTIIPGD